MPYISEHSSYPLFWKKKNIFLFYSDAYPTGKEYAFMDINNTLLNCKQKREGVGGNPIVITRDLTHGEDAI